MGVGGVERAARVEESEEVWSGGSGRRVGGGVERGARVEESEEVWSR
jgi:hypothetical protein